MKEIILIVIFIISISSFAQFSSADQKMEKEAEDILIELRSGESIQGSIIEENETTVVVKSESMGILTIDRKNIKEMIDLKRSTGYRYNDPNHNSLLFMPSAETNSKGTKYFSSYELVYLNLGASPTDNLNVAVGFIFPFTPDVIAHTPLSIGFKYRLLHRPEFINFSLVTSYSTILEADDFSLITVGGAFNYYFNPTTTANLYVGNIFNPNDTDDKIIHFGAALTKRVSPSSKFIIEYMNGMWEDFTTDGTLLIGIRFFGKKLSADFAVIRFLEFSDNSNEPWFMIPLVNFTYHF